MSLTSSQKKFNEQIKTFNFFNLVGTTYLDMDVLIYGENPGFLTSSIYVHFR